MQKGGGENNQHVPILDEMLIVVMVVKNVSMMIKTNTNQDGVPRLDRFFWMITPCIRA